MCWSGSVVSSAYSDSALSALRQLLSRVPWRTHGETRRVAPLGNAASRCVCVAAAGRCEARWRPANGRRRAARIFQRAHGIRRHYVGLGVSETCTGCVRGVRAGRRPKTAAEGVAGAHGGTLPSGSVGRRFDRRRPRVPLQQVQSVKVVRLFSDSGMRYVTSVGPRAKTAASTARSACAGASAVVPGDSYPSTAILVASREYLLTSFICRLVPNLSFAAK